MFGALESKLSAFGIPFSESLGKIGERLQDVENRGHKLSGTMSEIGKAMTLGMGGAAVAIGGVGVEAALAAQKVEAQLKTAVVNTGGSFEEFEPKMRAADATLPGAAKRCMFPGFKAVNCSYGVPDILYHDASGWQVWEVKAESQAGLALGEALWYKMWLHTVTGENVTLGDTFPGATVASDGSVVTAPAPGVVVYARPAPPAKRVPDPKTAPEPHRVPNPVPQVAPGPNGQPIPAPQTYQDPGNGGTPGPNVVPWVTGLVGGGLGAWWAAKALSPLCGPAVVVCAIAG